MQLINESAPLSNVGFCIYGNITPDVANNLRFQRYIWLDTTTVPATPKFYNINNGQWEVGSIDLTDLSIEAIQLFIDTVGVWISNVHVKSDFTADAAQGYFIARAKSNGKDCELVDLPTALTDGGNVPIANIQTNTAGDKMFLVTDVVAGVKTASWRTFAPATDINNGQLPLAKLAAGTNGYIPQMVGGVPVWVDPTTVVTQGGGGATNRVKDLITAKDGGQVDGNSAPFHPATALMVPTVGVDLIPSWQLPVYKKQIIASSVFSLPNPPFNADANTAFGNFVVVADLVSADGFPPLVELFLQNNSGKNGHFVSTRTEGGVLIPRSFINAEHVFEAVSANDRAMPVFSWWWVPTTGLIHISINCASGYRYLPAGTSILLTPGAWELICRVSY